MNEILIVDDERTLRNGLKIVLRGEGYDVRTAQDGEEAIKKIAAKRPDLVLLDVMMPKMNGFRCCEEIRKTDAFLPIVFLTAVDSEANEIRAKGLGGDDFVSKTASDALLLACVRRALARVQHVSAQRVTSTNHLVRLGSVVADFKTFSVMEGDKEISRLTKTEADILSFLSAHRGEIVLFDDLIAHLRGRGFACEDTMLYSHVSHLRTKLGKAGDLITTKRGVGYSLIK